MILTDALADRIHAAGVESLRIFAQAYADLRSDAAAKTIGTGFALYAGEGSLFTQCGGFGHRTPDDPAEIEAFFGPHTPDWEVTVTPFTHPDTVRALLAAGYRFVGFEAVLAQRIGDGPETSEHEIVEVGEDVEAWLEASTRAWEENEGETVEPSEFARAAATTPIRRYVAYSDGVPAATASMTELTGAALFMGGATRVPYRGRGLQTALIARRLRDSKKGELAIIGARPGSTSFRNAQRLGFAPLYSTLILSRR